MGEPLPQSVSEVRKTKSETPSSRYNAPLRGGHAFGERVSHSISWECHAEMSRRHRDRYSRDSRTRCCSSTLEVSSSRTDVRSTLSKKGSSFKEPWPCNNPVRFPCREQDWTAPVQLAAGATQIMATAGYAPTPFIPTLKTVKSTQIQTT